MWFTIVSIIYVLVCSFLVLVVLLQQGKGGGMGSAFGGGGGGSNTVFGGAGAGNFLTRLTAIAATLFMVLSATLAYLSTSGEDAIEEAETVEQEQNAEEEEDTLSGDGADEAPSRDTPEDAENDPEIDALEQQVLDLQLGESDEGDVAVDEAETEAPATEAPEEAPAPAEEAPAPAEEAAPAE